MQGSLSAKMKSDHAFNEDLISVKLLLFTGASEQGGRLPPPSQFFENFTYFPGNLTPKALEFLSI